MPPRFNLKPQVVWESLKELEGEIIAVIRSLKRGLRTGLNNTDLAAIKCSERSLRPVLIRRFERGLRIHLTLLIKKLSDFRLWIVWNRTSEEDILALIRSLERGLRPDLRTASNKTSKEDYVSLVDWSDIYGLICGLL